MIGSNNRASTFTQFVAEARGFSETVGEYSQLAQAKIHESLDKYLSFKFKKRFTNYSDDIVIDDAHTQVSQEAARDFPISEIIVQFRVVALKSLAYQNRSGWYLSNYDKYRLRKTGRGKLNIIIQCKIILPYEGLNADRDLAIANIREVMNHELTHAYNDYKDPNFMKGYRGALLHSEVEKYDFLRDSSGMKNFLRLIYTLSDAEIMAQLGEAPSYDSKEELYQTDAYRNATMGREFTADEYFDVISAELANHKFSEYITNNFGEFFVDLYKKVSRKRSIVVDPKILNLKKSAGLLEVLQFFEPYLRAQGEVLWRKLVKKIN